MASAASLIESIVHAVPNFTNLVNSKVDYRSVFLNFLDTFFVSKNFLHCLTFSINLTFFRIENSFFKTFVINVCLTISLNTYAIFKILKIIPWCWI